MTDISTDAGTGVPVSGELVTPPEAAVIPSKAEENSAADRARGRTAVQVGIPAAIVGIGSWLARLYDIDLDPGVGVDLPADVAGYFVAVLTVALAFRMNRKSK
jgi:hypothetical protein